MDKLTLADSAQTDGSIGCARISPPRGRRTLILGPDQNESEASMAISTSHTARGCVLVGLALGAAGVLATGSSARVAPPSHVESSSRKTCSRRSSSAY